MIEVFMPKLGPSIEQATVVRWYKSQGDSVRQGETILDIETEKTVHEVAAEAEGILHEIFIPEGQSCVVGTVLALLGEAGESVARAPKADARPSVSAIVEAPAQVGTATPARNPDAAVIDRLLIKSSPAARRVAREKGVDLSTVSGTGPRGRIVSEDVVRAAGTAEPAAGAVPQAAAAAREPVPARAVPVATPINGVAIKEKRSLSSVRRAIAERMVQSKHNAPHFYVSMDADMTRVQEARAGWKNDGETSLPSYNDFILWATARALRAHPELNASLVGEEHTIYADISVGMATSVSDGLVVPVIRRADTMSVRGIACHGKNLAAKARDKKLVPADCEGGTFTVSNLGMFGVDSFVAIINPPQCAILAVGQVAPRVVTDGNSIAIRSMVTMTLSIDHRIADGVVASRFLGALKEALETFQESQ